MTVTIERKFSVAMAKLLFNMREKDLANSMIITDDQEQIPLDFINDILNDLTHSAEIVSKIGLMVLEDVLLNPVKYKDENNNYQYIPELYEMAYCVDGYIEDQYKKTRNKTVYLCMYCHSDNVNIMAWVKPNQKYEFVSEIENGTDLGYCCDCGLRTIVETASLKSDAHVIGYQVVGEDGTPQEGEIHPQMDASFCVYSLEQARQMLNDNDNGEESWRLLTVWEGDIEEPTLMFDTTIKFQ